MIGETILAEPWPLDDPSSAQSLGSKAPKSIGPVSELREGVEPPEHPPRPDAAVTCSVAPPSTTTKVRQRNETEDHQPEDHRQRVASGMLPLLLRLLGLRDVLLRLFRRQVHLL